MIAIYYALTIAMLGNNPPARLRAPIVPIGCVFAAVGIAKARSWLVSSWRLHVAPNNLEHSC